jgi:hypothetical protein
MPFRLDQFKAKVAFVTFAAMPSMVYKACEATGTVSLTRYYQEAVCEKLSRDLNVPLDHLLARLPPPRGKAATLLTPPSGPSQNNEAVR